MAYSRRRAGPRRARAAASRTRRAPARGRSTARRSSGARRSAQTVKLVIQTVPYGGSDPFKAPAAAPRAAKH